jgi:hypothetical protein
MIFHAEVQYRSPNHHNYFNLKENGTLKLRTLNKVNANIGLEHSFRAQNCFFFHMLGHSTAHIVPHKTVFEFDMHEHRIFKIYQPLVIFCPG